MATIRRLTRPSLDYPLVPYHELLQRTVDRFPDKWATVFHDRMLSFRELDGMSNSLAASLRELHVGPGDRVALYMTNRPEYLIAFEAVSKVGGVVTPLNPAYREAEAEYQLGNSEARAVVVHADNLNTIAAIRGRLRSLQSVIVVGDAPGGDTIAFDDAVGSKPGTRTPSPPVDPAEDLIALPYSSGTTGLPKGVMLSHRNLISNHIQCTSAGRLTERDTLLLFLPYYHIYGTMLMGAAVAAGATQVIMERFDMVTALSLVQEHRVTLFYAVPPVLLAMAHFADLKKYDLGSVRYIMSGAAPLPPEVGRQVQHLTGIKVLQGYGLTEAAPLTHLNPTDRPEDVRMESVGLPVSDEEQRIVDLETGAEVGPDQIGELVIRGPHVMRGYWREPEETARVLRDGWLSTGDIARCDADGYVYIIDRKKEMIKYKGFGVAPAELEALLHEHPGVQDCAVVPKADPEAGEIPKAFVVLKPGTSADAAELMRFVEGKVAGYKRIRAVEFIDAIPKNPSGKILRRVLKERA